METHLAAPVRRHVMETTGLLRWTTDFGGLLDMFEVR